MDIYFAFTRMVLEVHLWRGKYNITGWDMTTSENFMTMCKMLVLCEIRFLVSKLQYTCWRWDVAVVGALLWSLVVRCSSWCWLDAFIVSCYMPVSRHCACNQY